MPLFGNCASVQAYQILYGCTRLCSLISQRSCCNGSAISCRFSSHKLKWTWPPTAWSPLQVRNLAILWTNRVIGLQFTWNCQLLWCLQYRLSFHLKVRYKYAALRVALRVAVRVVMRAVRWLVAIAHSCVARVGRTVFESRRPYLNINTSTRQCQVLTNL